MNRQEAKAIRWAEEQAWQRAGEQDFYKGVKLTDWPRPEKKYGNLWYRTKVAWQRGWMQASGLMSPGLTPVPWTAPALPSDRLAVLIEELSPIRVRDLVRKFSMPHRKEIERELIRLANEGQVQMTGGGHRGSPLMITKIGFVEVELNKPEEADIEST
jgi:hypothetical protein